MEGEGLRREEDGLQSRGRARIVVVGAALLEDQTKTRSTLSSSDERPVGKWAELEEAAFASEKSRGSGFKAPSDERKPPSLCPRGSSRARVIRYTSGFEEWA